MENETEIWKKHPDIPGIEVSTFGRVRTLDRTRSNGKGMYLAKGHILKQHDNGKGYLQLGVSINKQQVCKKVHRLVAETYIKNPDGLPQVNHKDCNRKNNNVENLEWCDNSYNVKYREKYGKAQSKSLFAINLATLEVSQFQSQGEAGRIIGVSQGNIYSVLKGKRNHTHGFWFVNDDDNAVDLTKQKLRYLGKTRLTAADEASADFVSQVIAE